MLRCCIVLRCHDVRDRIVENDRFRIEGQQTLELLERVYCVQHVRICTVTTMVIAHGEATLSIIAIAKYIVFCTFPSN